MVVEVALGRQHGPRPGQNSGHHLLYGGLATAAGDGDERPMKTLAVGQGDLTQSHLSIGDDPLRLAQGPIGHRHYQTTGAISHCRQEPMTVKALTT